jgi:KTSC domain
MRMRPVMLAAAMFACALCADPSLASAESVYVKYRGEVDLMPFDCTDITRSSFIRRVCYDEANEYMLINLSGTYYHYCAIDDGTVSALLAADSSLRPPFSPRRFLSPSSF